MMGWLGGEGGRLERGSVHSPPLAQLWRPTKFFILCLRVSGSKLRKLLLSCARHIVHWENLGVPYLVKPENPLCKTCAAHFHLCSEGWQMFLCMCSTVHTCFRVCPFCVLRNVAMFHLWQKSNFLFSSEGRRGFGRQIADVVFFFVFLPFCIGMHLWGVFCLVLVYVWYAAQEVPVSYIIS